MKKLLFLIAGIIFSLSSMGQQLNLSDVAGVDLPPGAQKITKEQALDHVNKKFNRNKVTLSSISTRGFQHTYKTDDIIVSLYTESISVNENHLLELKKGLDAMSRGDKTYTSILKKVNNNNILIIHSMYENIEKCNFYCYNANYTVAVAGILEYNVSDKEKATTVLEHIINSIKFKE